MVRGRVPLGVPWPRRPDPAASRDPVIRELVGRLRSLPAGPPMRPEFRAELRAQLVAVTPRLVAEGVGPTDRRATGARRRRGARTRSHRPLVVIGGAFVVLVMLLAGAVWLSGNTLPGDTLYSLKRASENVQLSLTGGDTDRGNEYFDLAKIRVDEVTQLVDRTIPSAGSAGGQRSARVDAHTASLVTRTLNAADSDTRNAARLLTGEAVEDRSAGPLTAVTRWAHGQLGRLAPVVAALPPGSLHDRAAASSHLLSRLLTRADRLRPLLGCGCFTTTDDLGPVPPASR